MMTTESKPLPTSVGTRVLLRSGGLGLVVVIGLAVVAALVTGSSGAAGVLVGGVAALLVFLGGSLTVNTVAGLMPALSLVFALMTYLLQVLVLGLFFTSLTNGDLLGSSLDAGWLGGAIIVVALVWVVAQILLFTRARIPVYDLPSRAGER